MPSKRRPKGEGSITVLSSGKVRIRVEIDPIDGKRQWLSATADTKKEAVEKLKKLQRDKEDNVLQRKAAEDTIIYQGQEYLRHLRALKRSGTVLRHANFVIRELATHLNSLALSKVDIKAVDTLLTLWNSRGLMQSTINAYISCLREFFNWCLESDLMRKNPLRNYKVKTSRKKQKTKMYVLSSEEHRKIKGYFYTYWVRKRKPIKRWSLKFRMFGLYCLAYETGMREGEIAALTWDDIDIEHNTVRVKSTISVQEDFSKIIKDPKSDAGFRSIIISEKTMQLLIDLKDFTGELSEYVFYNHKTHSHYMGNGFYDAFTKAVRRAGIDRAITFHDIRHTNASNMIYKNVPIAVITERLGHSSIAITYATYGHIIKECKEAKVAVIEA